MVDIAPTGPGGGRVMRRWLLAIVLVLIALAAGLALAAPWLVERGVLHGLREAGFEDAAVGGVSVGLDRLVLEDVRIGEPPAHRAARVSITYRPADLAGGRIEAVAIDGLVLQGTLDERGFRLAGRREAKGTGPSALPPVLPARIRLTESRLDLETPLGPTRLPLAAEIVPGDGRAAVTAEITGARLAGEGREIDADLELRADLPLAGDLDLEQISAEGRLRIEAALGEMPTGDTRGTATFDFTFADTRLIATTEDARARIGDDPRVGDAEIRLGRTGAPLSLTLAPLGQGYTLEAEGPIRASAEPGGLEGDLALAVETGPGLAFRRLAPSRLDLRFEPFGAGGLEVEEARLALDLAGNRDALSGTAEVELAGHGRPLPDLEIEDGQLTQRLAVEASPERLILRATEPGQLRAASARWQERIALAPIAVTLEGTDAPLLELQLADGAWQVAIDADTAPLEVTGDGIDGPVELRESRLQVRAEGAARALDEARVALALDAATAPAQALALADAETEIVLGADGLAEAVDFPLRIARVRNTASPAWFAPLGIEGSWQRADAAIAFDLEATSVRGPGARVRGQHDPASGQGRATLAAEPLVFAADGLQPADLVPILRGELEDVAGSLDLDGELAWDGASLGGDLSLLIEDLALEAGPARFEGLNGLLRFDHLLPPGTPAGQQLAIGLLDVGLPLTDGLATFALDAGALEVERLRFRWAGGTLRAEPFRVGSADSDISLTLRAQGLDLAAIFEQVRLPGLSGEGTIDGTLPLTLGGADAVIEGGELVARGPGRLRYRPSEPPPGVDAGGEGIDLLLQALEDFRYDGLRITLDGRTDATMDIGLHLNGANPELYDGYPIEFNLALEGELANILRRGLGSYSLPERIREQMENRRRR